MPEQPPPSEGLHAPGHHAGRFEQPSDVAAIAWPVPLRLASWGRAVQLGLSSPTDAAIAGDITESMLDFGQLCALGLPLIGFLAEPGHPAVAPLPQNLVPSVITAGGALLAIGAPGALVVAPSNQGRAYFHRLELVVHPPAESLGVAERRLFDAVASAADVIASLGVSSPDPQARATLSQLPNLLDEYPMPPGTSGRARLLRDRAATLVVGVELALAPAYDAPTTALDAPRRTALADARLAARLALTAASNEASLTR